MCILGLQGAEALQVGAVLQRFLAQGAVFSHEVGLVVDVFAGIAERIQRRADRDFERMQHDRNAVADFSEVVQARIHRHEGDGNRCEKGQARKRTRPANEERCRVVVFHRGRHGRAVLTGS